MSILSDECGKTKFNVGSLIGSSIGGGLGAAKAYGAGSSGLGQVSGAFLSGGPSLAAGAIGTGLGGGIQ